MYPAEVVISEALVGGVGRKSVAGRVGGYGRGGRIAVIQSGSPILWERWRLHIRFPVLGLQRLRHDVHNFEVHCDTGAALLLRCPAAILAQPTQRQLRGAKVVRIQQRVDRVLGTARRTRPRARATRPPLPALRR